MNAAKSQPQPTTVSFTPEQRQLVLGLRYAVKNVGDGVLHALLPLIGNAAGQQETEARFRDYTPSSRYVAAARAAVTGPQWDTTLAAGVHIAEQARRHGLTILLRGDPGYPAHLTCLDPTKTPTVLFARGATAVDTKTVACVGTRTPSEFGVRSATRVSELLAEHGWTIVSGLAKGVDTIAHRTALMMGVRTVAVLGNGLDHIYPAENTALAEEIVAAGGLLLSEQPPGQRASAYSLVQRDRIQSGMSVATIVFETAIDGGSMRTAAFAVSQGRPLITVVPPPAYTDLPSCSGNRQLLAQQAYPLAHRSAYPKLLADLDAWRAAGSADS